MVTPTHQLDSSNQSDPSITQNTNIYDYSRLSKITGLSSDQLLQSQIIGLIVGNKMDKIIISPESCVRPYIVNLSRYSLSPDEESLLNKGLKFCPTPGPLNFGELRNDLIVSIDHSD